MADTDNSLYNLRYNQVTMGIEGFGGGSPIWTPLSVVAGNGISQLTGDVTAGPGAGSQTATIAASAITNAKVSASAAIAYSKLAALPSANILVGNGSNVATAVALSGAVTITNAGVASLTNASVINQVITGYTSGAGTISASDSILGAIQKLNGNDALSLPLTGGTLTGNLAITAATGNSILTLSGTLRNGLIYVDKADSDAFTIDPGTGTLFIAHPNSGLLEILHYTIQSSQDIHTSTKISAGTNVPDASAILTASSTTSGFLPPRMTTTQKNAISTPTEGLMVYDATLHKLSVFTGTVWETVTSA